MIPWDYVFGIEKGAGRSGKGIFIRCGRTSDHWRMDTPASVRPTSFALALSRRKQVRRFDFLWESQLHIQAQIRQTCQ